MAFKSELYKVDPETGDLLPTAKRTLGDYLSRRTSKAVDSPEATGGPDDFTYNPPRANPFPIAPEISTGIPGPSPADLNNQPVFARDQEDLERWGQSGNFDTDKFILNDLDQQDRHRLLKQVETSGDSKNDLTVEMQRQVSVNLSRNRFASNKAFATGENPNPTVEARTQGRVPVSTNAGTNSLYEQMANQALSALIVATGETPKDPAINTSEDDVVNPSALQGNFNTLTGDGLPTLDTSKLHPEDVGNYARLAFDPKSAEKLDNVKIENEGVYTKYSVGNLNSYLEPFGTALPTSMIAAAGVLLVCAVVLTLTTAALLNFIARSIPVDTGIKPLGADRGDPFGTTLQFTGENSFTDFFCKLLGLIHPYPSKGITKNIPYLEAAFLGVASFVGIDFSKISVDSYDRNNPSKTLDISGLITNTLGGSGYYVVMVRNVLRSLTFLSDSAKSQLGNVGSPSLSTVEGLAAFVSDIKHSKIVRFTDTMARLGVVKQMVDMRAGYNAMTAPGDSGEDNPTTRLARSRAFRREKVLSYSHSLASNSGKYLLPKNFKYASIAYNNGVKNVSSLARSGVEKMSTEVYLTPEDVKKIEDNLEAEYVPFYLHDLRTNEILNFHAFIESLDDSYSASWNAVDGYGRMDPVQIYKGTTRSISVAFTIVATNPDDFQRMWWTINRLTMMVYPQWTAGDELEGFNADGKTYTFTQPFSQVIGAAPLVRVRVGDVIHSNYSRFNLARIFGLGGVSVNTGKRHFVVEGEEKTSAKIEYLALPRDLQSDLGILGKIKTEGETAQTLTNKFVGVIVLINPGSGYGAGLTPDDVRSSAGAPYSASPVKSLKGTLVEFVTSTNAAGKEIFTAVISLTVPTPAESLDADGEAAVVDANYLAVDVDNISPDQEFYENLYKSVPPADGSKENTTENSMSLETLSALSENFGSPKNYLASDKSNSLVRSFEAAGGRGIACAITSLGYTWYDDSITWETEQGKRAPMSCKVSIALAPIHDIPMGLDADGFPRAVPYPVGDLVRSTFFPELHNNDIETVRPMIEKKINDGMKQK